MYSTGTIVCAGVIAAILPLSVASLYFLLLRHTPLAAESASDVSVLARFDNEGEIGAFELGLQHAAELRTAQTLALYRRLLLAASMNMGPEQGKPYLDRLFAGELGRAEEAAPTAVDPSAVSVDEQAAPKSESDAPRGIPRLSRASRFRLWSRRDTAGLRKDTGN